MRNPKGGQSDPSQPVRLAWFLLYFLTPFAALSYVRMYGLENGNEEALTHVLLILAASLIVSLVCGLVMPIISFDEARMRRNGRFSLFLAIINMMIVMLLFYGHTSSDRPYPLGLLAFAGMFFCYAVGSYTLLLRHSPWG